MPEHSPNKVQPKDPDATDLEPETSAREGTVEKDLVDALPDNFDEEQRKFDEEQRAKQIEALPPDFLKDLLAQLEIADEPGDEKSGENTNDKSVPVSDAKVPAIVQSLPDLLKTGAVGPIKDYVVGLQNFEEAKKAIATITEASPENVLEILREIAKSDSHATGPAISELLSIDEIDSDNTLVEERWKSGELAKLFESNKLSGANFLGAIACTNSAEGGQYVDKYFDSLNGNPQAKEKLAFTILTKSTFMPGFEFDMIKPETRSKAIEFLATRETPEAGKVLTRMLIEKEKGIAEAAEKALSKKWTTQSSLDAAGESRNAFAVGDRLQRFTRDLSGKSWNDGQNFAEIESEYKSHKLLLDESARNLAVKLGRGDTERELEIEKRIDDKSFIEDLIKRRPNAKPLYDQYLQEKADSAHAVGKYNSLLAARALDLQAKIDPYCKELGIPTPKVEFFPPEGTTFRGSHQNGSNSIALNTSLMKGGTISSDMVSTIFHEVGHHEQSQQVARMLADELKLGKNATSEDVQKLKTEFESRHGNRFEGQSEFFEDVLKLRNGELLSSEENQRAKKLLDSFVDHYEAGERQAALNERAERMSDRAQRFKSPIPLFVLMSGKDPIAEAKRALETDNLPPDLEKDLKKWKDVSAKFSPESEEIETKVREGMQLALLRDASYSSREAHKQYRDRFHEVETWDISARSRLFGGAHKSDIMARSQSDAIVASKPKAEQGPNTKRPTASEIEVGHLVRSGDFEKLKAFLETTTSAESAKLGVWKMTAAQPANLLEKLRTISSGDSYAAGPAMAALALQSDDAKDMSYLKEQHQSGRLLEMFKSQKLTASDYVSILDYSGSEFCKKESALLLDKLSPTPALKTEIAKQLIAMDDYAKSRYEHEWVTPETRMKAMAHLISSGEEGLKIVKELTLSESLEVSKLAKDAIREAWTTGKPNDGAGAAQNELVTGDRLRRFSEDLVNRSWPDNTKISDLLVEHDKAFKEFEKRGEALAKKILGPGTDRETRFELISELFLDSKKNEILGKHPELRAEYDRFLKAQEQYESVDKHFRDLTTKRGKALEAHLNQYCKEMGITTPKIRFYNPLGGDNVDGISVNGRGRISLSAALMGDSKSPTAEFLNTLFHEVGHQEQDNLVIRRLADELKIGKTPTSEQFEALRKLYAKREGGGEKPSRAYLEEVLDVRDGQTLNEAQSQRADKLMESYRSLQEFSARERSLEARIQRYDKVSKALVDGASLEKLVGSKDPIAGAERLLKTKKIPADLATALKAWGDATVSKAADITVLEANVRQMLIERCAERKRVASNESMKAYRGRLHEIEAWDVGARASFFSREAIEKQAASRKALEPMLSALPEKPIDWFSKRAEKPSDLAKRNPDNAAETARKSHESPYLSHNEKAAASALQHTIDNGLQIAGEKISLVDGVHKLQQPIKLDLGGKPLTIVSIEYRDGEIYLKDGSDGKRHRAKPWIDALSEGLAHNVESEGASIERASSSKQTLQMMQGSAEAKIAMVRALAETYAKNSLPPAQDVSSKQPELIAREGNSTGESTALRPGSMGGDVRKTVAGGYEVTEKVGEKAPSSSNFEGVPREEIARLREEIVKDKSGKMSPQEKADSLRVLELAEQGDLRAKDAVRRAYGDAARNDGRFDRAAGRLVAIGMVVSTLAGWYAYSRMQSVQPSEAQKAKIR